MRLLLSLPQSSRYISSLTSFAITTGPLILEALLRDVRSPLLPYSSSCRVPLLRPPSLPLPSPPLPSPSLLALQFSQQPTAFVYCEMLRACEQRRLWLQVDELWAHMRAGGVTPDAACWQVRAAHSGGTGEWGWERGLRSGGEAKSTGSVTLGLSGPRKHEGREAMSGCAALHCSLAHAVTGLRN